MKEIFLAGAHTEGAPLPELVAEIRTLEAILRPLHERGVWGLESNRAANLADVFGTFSRLGAQIALFHYAGHANQQELHFDGGGQLRGIAELFGLTQGSGLQFVFLNGCASAGQVGALHQAGVGAVIATSRPIGDQLARDFALSEKDARYPMTPSFDDFVLGFGTLDAKVQQAVLASLADSPMKRTLAAFAPAPDNGVSVQEINEQPQAMLERLTQEALDQKTNVAPDLLLSLQAM